jgi:TRAP-type C4-dicarboxylate transport system substrate-binding protein
MHQMIKAAFFPCLAAPKAGRPVKALSWIATLTAFLLFPFTAIADPITLKLSFFSSNRSLSYIAAVKPFVDAVNADGKGLVQVEVYFSGASGKDIAQQPQLILDGAFDIAFVVPGYSPDQFPDNALMELPGQFHDMREGSLVYTQLIALDALRGYDDFFVIGAYVSDPETIHGKTPINSIDDLKGKRIRVGNQTEIGKFEKLGAIPVPLPVNEIAEALSSGTIDAAAVSLTPLTDYGIKRVATHHYFLRTNGAPLALLMNRKRFEGATAGSTRHHPEAQRDMGGHAVHRCLQRLRPRSVETTEIRSSAHAGLSFAAGPQHRAQNVRRRHRGLGCEKPALSRSYQPYRNEYRKASLI